MDDKVKGVEIDPVREKLIELIEESTGCTYGGEYGDEVVENEIDISYSEIERIADHLIANGVVIAKMETTTKWIPVTDENPKEAGEYIVKIAYASAATALWYNPVEDVWFSDDYRDTYTVTHWMPLPEQPKGE